MINQYLNTVTTGDARLLTATLPDESIDVIMTDPVYDNFEDYYWLSQEAMRILKPNSPAFIWCGIGYLPQTIQMLQLGGLTYRWTCGSIIWGQNNRGDYGIYSKWACMLWFDKGRSKPAGWTFDMHQSSAGNRTGNNHRWQKNPKALMSFLRLFPGTVFDPFCGGGSTLIACKILGYPFVAFEINEETAKDARANLAAVQPPLLFEQASLLTETD